VPFTSTALLDPMTIMSRDTLGSESLLAAGMRISPWQTMGVAVSFLTRSLAGRQ
jgi:hypothetical protein